MLVQFNKGAQENQDTYLIASIWVKVFLRCKQVNSSKLENNELSCRVVYSKGPEETVGTDLLVSGITRTVATTKWKLFERCYLPLSNHYSSYLSVILNSYDYYSKVYCWLPLESLWIRGRFSSTKHAPAHHQPSVLNSDLKYSDNRWEWQELIFHNQKHNTHPNRWRYLLR